MADVILIYPYTGYDVLKASVDLPMSVLTAATLVAREFDTVIIDQRTDPMWRRTLALELELGPICVGISAMSGPQLLYGLEAAKIVRDWNPEIPIIWGGVHPTLLPEQTLSHPMVDVVVIGDGEQPLLSIARAIGYEDGNLSDIPGILVKGEEIPHEEQPFLDLNILPDLPYHLVDVEKYIGTQGRFEDKNVRALAFLSSRGCPYHCGYCCNQGIYHNTWRALTAERTFERTSALVEKYNLDCIMFLDDELIIEGKRAEKLADMIDNRFGWWCQCRMDGIMRLDMFRLERGGLRVVQPGIESGSPRVLRLVRKAESVETMILANRKLARTSIKPLYNFMMGFPTETKDELMESVDLATRMLDENPKAELIAFYNYVPYPGTDLFDLSVQQGFYPPQSLEEWGWFTRQRLITPWIQKQAELFNSISVMSKFVDGKRMLRRLRDHSHLNRFSLWILRQLVKLYQYRWRRHQFERPFEAKVTGWIRNKLFHW